MEQNRHQCSLNLRKQKTYDNLISKGINKMKKFTALSLALILVLSLFAGCSSKETASAKNPEVSEIVAKIDEVLAEKNGGEENMIAKMDGDDEMTSTFYYLNTEDLESYSLKFPMINVKAEETFVAKVKDGKMDAVKEAPQHIRNIISRNAEKKTPVGFQNIRSILRPMEKYIVIGNYEHQQGDNSDKRIIHNLLI